MTLSWELQGYTALATGRHLADMLEKYKGVVQANDGIVLEMKRVMTMYDELALDVPAKDLVPVKSCGSRNKAR